MHSRIFYDDLDRIRKTCAARALLVSANKKEKAAELLGISKFTIRGWIFRFSLETTGAQERVVKEGIDLPEGYNVESVYRVTAKSRLQEILKAHRGNRTAAARALGVGRRTLHHKLAEFGLRHRDKLVSNEQIDQLANKVSNELVREQSDQPSADA